MPEDQMSALPPELRTMVMTGATAMMNGGGPNPNMMAGMNPMMDMSGMGGMNMGPMGMGMNGDMQMQMQQGGPMMPEGQGQGPNGPSDQVQMAMPDGYNQGPNGQGMMGMNMGGEYAMQQVKLNLGTLKPEPDHSNSTTRIKWASKCTPAAWRAAARPYLLGLDAVRHPFPSEEGGAPRREDVGQDFRREAEGEAHMPAAQMVVRIINSRILDDSGIYAHACSAFD